MRISDWSSDVCSSDLTHPDGIARHQIVVEPYVGQRIGFAHPFGNGDAVEQIGRPIPRKWPACEVEVVTRQAHHSRSEEHTSELQSLMRISYAVFCLKKKNNLNITNYNLHITSSLLKL